MTPLPLERPVVPRTLPDWGAEILYRMRKLWLLKMVGTTIFLWIFFIGYFHLLRHPVYPPFVMPLTALDHLIPFYPVTFVAYVSLWLYVGIAPGLERSFSELLVYGLWVSALCLTGLACFYFWPTQLPPQTLDATTFPGFAILKGVDAVGNACPSMHVATAMFTAIRLDDILRRARTPQWMRIGNALWLVAIAFSTLAIKQHVALDALAGAGLGLAFAMASLRWRPTPARRIGPDIIRFHRSSGVSLGGASTDKTS